MEKLHEENLGRAETVVGNCLQGEGAVVMERGKHQRAHTEKMNPHNVWPWRSEGLNSKSLYNQGDLEPGA